MKTTVLSMAAVFSTFAAAAVQDDVSAPFSAAVISQAYGSDIKTIFCKIIHITIAFFSVLMYNDKNK